MIYLIITTSICDKYCNVDNYESRKQLYVHSISTALNLIQGLNIKPIIVENNGFRQTYLDDLGCDVVYTNNNDTMYFHKGVTELLDICYCIDKYNICDDDYIIKLTGRYTPLSSHFFNTVIDNINRYDAFVKFMNICQNQYDYKDCVLGFYSIKCKYLKQFKYDGTLSAEVEFATFVRNNVEKDKILEILDLQILCSDKTV